MFGIGTQELLVILVVALLLFSPKELPRVIKSFAQFWGTIRRTADDFRSAVLENEELREPIEEIRTAYRGARTEIRDAEDAARRELARAKMEVRRAERRLEQAGRNVTEPPEAPNEGASAESVDEAPTVAKSEAEREGDSEEGDRLGVA